MRVKAVITDVSDSTKGPAIVVSRRSPELIKSLFELEVPEIADKLVEIVGAASLWKAGVNRPGNRRL